MNFIKKLAVLGMGIMLFASPASFAADECITYDKDTYCITVAPEADKKNAYANINLFMHIKSDKKIDEMTPEEFSQLTPYFYDDKADENGTAFFDFVFTGESGNYKIYVSSSVTDKNGNGVFYEDEMWIDSQEDLRKTLEGLNQAITNGTMDIYIQDADVRRMLEIDDMYVNISDKTMISKALMSLGTVASYADVREGLADVYKLAELEKEIKALDKSTVWTQIKPVVDKYFIVTGTACDEYTYYSKQSNTSGIDKKLLANIPFTGLNDFFEDFKKAVADYKKSSQSQGGSSSGGSSSGGLVIGGATGGASVTVSGQLNGTQPTVPSTPNESGFNDVPDSYWAKGYITALVGRGVVKGVGSNNFAPESNVTREQYIAMLLRVANIESGYEISSFNDVKQGEWYYPAVAKAEKIGLASGYANGNFGIGDNITREDLCVLGYRLIQQRKNIEAEEVKELNFTDKDKISSYAIEAVEFMQNNGIIHGYDDGSFKPLGKATRAEACIIIYLISQFLN